MVDGRLACLPTSRGKNCKYCNKHRFPLNHFPHSPDKPRGRPYTPAPASPILSSHHAREPVDHRPPSRPPGGHPARPGRDRAIGPARGDRGFDRDVARVPHRRHQPLPARLERLRGDDGPRLRRRAPGAPRRHARLGRVGPAPRRAVRAPRHLPDPARDVRLGGRRRQAVRPRLGAERRPRRLAPRRRAVRADAPLRRAHAGDPVGRRAVHRHATVGRGARGARGRRRPRRPGAPELPGGGRGRTPPARASRAPPGVIAARRDAGGRGDPPGHLRRDPARARVPEGLDPAPRHRVGRVHDARDDRLDARRAGAERAALDVGARAASRPAVRDRGLLPAHTTSRRCRASRPGTACTGR